MDEPSTLAESQRRQRHIRSRRPCLVRAVTRGAQLKIMEVDALPAHGELDHAVKLAERECRGRQNAPPHDGADPDQPEFDLEDGVSRRLGLRCRRRGFGQRFIAPDYSLPARPSPDTPEILMLSVLSKAKMPLKAGQFSVKTPGKILVEINRPPRFSVARSRGTAWVTAAIEHSHPAPIGQCAGSRPCSPSRREENHHLPIRWSERFGHIPRIPLPLFAAPL